MKNLKEYLVEAVNGKDFKKKNDEFLTIDYMIKNVNTVEDLFVYIFAQLGLEFESAKKITDSHFDNLTAQKLKNAIKTHSKYTDENPFFIVDGYDLTNDIDELVTWLKSGEAFYLEPIKASKGDAVEFTIDFMGNDTVIFIPGY